MLSVTLNVTMERGLWFGNSDEHSFWTQHKQRISANCTNETQVRNVSNQSGSPMLESSWQPEVMMRRETRTQRDTSVRECSM